MTKKGSSWESKRDLRDFDITPTMEKFREQVESAGGTVGFDKVKVEGYWMPEVTVEWRGSERMKITRPTFYQACVELKDQFQERM